MNTQIKAKTAPKWMKYGLIVLVSMLLVAALGLWNDPEAHEWQKDSEDYVWGRMMNVTQNGIGARGSFMIGVVDHKGMEYAAMDQAEWPEKFQRSTYTSQSGLQGTAYGVLYRFFLQIGIEPQICVQLLYFINTTIFVVLWLLLAVWAYHERGPWAALGVMACLLLCPWLRISISNLYWVIWTMLLPTVLTLFWAQNWHRGSTSIWPWALVLLLVVMAKNMSGYEGITTVMLSSEMPVLYYWLKEGPTWENTKKWAFLGFVIGLLELAAFALAMGLWMLQMRHLLGKWDWVAILSPLAGRTGLFADQLQDTLYIQNCQNALDVGRAECVRYYVMSDRVLSMNLSFRQLLLLGAASTIPAALCKKVCGKSEHLDWKQIIFQIAFVGCCTLSTLSWFFLANGHAYIHVNVVMIFWLFPFVPVCTAMIFENLGSCVTDLFGKVLHRQQAKA